jgi:hypothetical protein
MIFTLSPFKKKQQLQIKVQIGPFICNNRGVGDEAGKLLKEMKFPTSFIWHYDPYGIISDMRLKNKTGQYVHEPRPEIEKFANQTEWEPRYIGGCGTYCQDRTTGALNKCAPHHHASDPQGKETPTGFISSCNRGIN